MICRKCGAELPGNAIRCTNCGIKVNMYCPECKTLNRFGNKHCKNCGFELIKSCPACGSANIYSAVECRKCHTKLEEYTPKKEEETSNQQTIEVVRAFSCNQAVSMQQNYYKEKPIVETNIENFVTTGSEELQIPQVKKIEKIFQVEETTQTTNSQNTESDENISENLYEETISEEPFIIVDNEELHTVSITPETNQTIKERDNIPTEDNKKEETSSQQTSAQEDNDYTVENEQEEQIDLDDNSKIEIQKEAVEKAVYLIKNSITKHVIAINGEEGSGKSAVLKQTSNYLAHRGFVSLFGSCTPLIQITSFGFFQDAFLRLMGFPPYINSTESFINDFKKSNFASPFECLNDNELNIFLNLFYPSKTAQFESILENKKTMFSILEKVIKALLVNNNIIITIDNFELLDGASYDFIIYMLNKGYFTNRLKLLVAYKENKSIQSYFDTSEEVQQIFETILLKKFDNESLIYTVSKSTNIKWNDILPSDLLDELFEKADGNAIRMEQQLGMLFDKEYVSLKNNIIVKNDTNKPSSIPATFEELIKIRLNALSPNSKNVLFMAAIMGFRFATSILCISVPINIKKSEQILDQLMQDMFIEYVDSYTCEFKSLTLWKLIYQEAKADLLYKENSERLYNSLKPLILSSNLQRLISCTEALSQNEAFEIWNTTANLTAKLGDTNLYVIAKKQCLKLLEKEEEFENSEQLKLQIYEEVGKLLCEKSPKEAVTYLANILDEEIKASNTRRIIDISGYFVKSCYLTGNYFGANEAVDAIIKNIKNPDSNVSALDLALIKTRKLKALLNIGNSEQIINIVNEEIMPDLTNGLYLKDIDPQYKEFIINAWLLSKIVLAKAYVIQGNNKVTECISKIREFIEKYNYNSEYYSTQVMLIEALYNSVNGQVNQSNEILNNITSHYNKKPLKTNLLAEWNLVNIINRVLSGSDDDLKVDLFELAAFTNNINEHFIKNTIKLILGYVLQEEGNIEKALEIYNEEITYFAKEKLAIGAMLSWALIVQITLKMGDDEKALHTATKSLEIAQSPKINNYFFIIYFQRYLAEIYLKKKDLAAAKMYYEKAIVLAKQLNMKYQLIDLYIGYAKYLEELMQEKKIYSSENVNTASEMYNKAVDCAKEINLQIMIDKAYKERSGFKTFCQLNSIEL